jgi:hypothetical protein
MNCEEGRRTALFASCEDRLPGAKYWNSLNCIKTLELEWEEQLIMNGWGWNKGY